MSSKKTLKKIKQGIKDVKKGRVTRVNNVTKFFKDLDEKRVKHPVYYFFHDNYYRIKRFLGDIPLNIKSFIQRGRRGYSDRDVWNLSYYLSDIIAKGVESLKHNSMGIPTWKENETSELEAQNKWDTILNSIIHTFKTAKEINNGDLLFTSSKDWTEAEYKKEKQFYDKQKYPKMFKPMTKKEVLEWEKGFLNFQKWFFSLWD